jgi:hypothetical protein
MDRHRGNRHPGRARSPTGVRKAAHQAAAPSQRDAPRFGAVTFDRQEDPLVSGCTKAARSQRQPTDGDQPSAVPTMSAVIIDRRQKLRSVTLIGAWRAATIDTLPA